MRVRHVVLSVLFFQERPGMWVAQALEHDISGSGPSIEKARIAFERTVFGYLKLDAQHKREPLSTVNRAPQGFWDIWENLRQAKMDAEEIRMADSSVPPAYMISAISNELLPVR
jgi:hypothetical protein